MWWQSDDYCFWHTLMFIILLDSLWISPSTSPYTFMTCTGTVFRLCWLVWEPIFWRKVMVKYVLYILWTAHHDTHVSERPTRCTLFLIISLTLSSTCFKEVIVHHQEEFCKRSLQYFTMHLKRSLVADTIRMIICIMSATRLLLRYMVKYCKLLVQNSSLWWTITCLKHVEDNLTEINY